MTTYNDQISRLNETVDKLVARYVDIIDHKLKTLPIGDEITQDIWGGSDEQEGVLLSDAVTKKLVEIYNAKGYYVYRHQEGSDWYSAYEYDGRYTFVLENRPCENKKVNGSIIGFIRSVFSSKE